MSYGRDEESGGRYGDQGSYGASNPYGSSGGYGGGSNPYGSSNPYGGDSEEYGAQNPYGQSNTHAQAQTTTYGQGNTYLDRIGQENLAAEPPSQPYSDPRSRPLATTNYSQSNYSRPSGYPTPGAQSPAAINTAQPTFAPAPVTSTVVSSGGVMENHDFLSRVEGVKAEIRQLTSNIAEIGTIHQRELGSTDNTSSAQLQNLVAQTQILNTRIKDQIKQLEIDAVKSGKNQTKDSQIRTLKSNFKSQLAEYQNEEMAYRQRYKEQIARQYRIVNPEATQEEVQQATEVDWGNEGVFQTALKSNRTGAANSVLGTVRARHNDIQQINRTLTELNQLFQDLAEAVVRQEAPVQQVEVQTQKVLDDTTGGNKQLVKARDSAARARKLKWICLIIVVLIILILALVLGLYFGLRAKNNK